MMNWTVGQKAEEPELLCCSRPDRLDSPGLTWPSFALIQSCCQGERSVAMVTAPPISERRLFLICK